MAWLVLVLFILASLAGGAAIAYVTGAAAVLSFILADSSRYLAILPQRILSQIDVFTFLAMPLFILAGELMNRGGVTRALIDLAMVLVGRMKGGLGHVNIAASVFMAGISGSAVADAAALTATLVPEMKARGYSATYAAALTAASSVIGPIIPPSIVMIFYGALMNVSVAALFAGGLLPGLLVALGLFVMNGILARRHGYGTGDALAMPPAGRTLVRAVPALFVPVIIVAGIVFGVVTPTEAAALAVVAALLIAFFYRTIEARPDGATPLTLLLRDIRDGLERTAVLTGSIFMILFAAAIFGYLIAIRDVPQAITDLVGSAGIDGLGYLLLINLVFFVAGMFMDVTMALVLLVPLLVPAAIASGADPVHVGVLSCLNLTIGLITPPFGGCLMIVSATSGVNYLRLSLAVLPFIAIEAVVLVVLILFPDITLVVPAALGLVE
ncbi:TRAP transporter large permease [Microbaculum marinum]|uniref:TRAP transporter large permease protein n=1 Tax=Microbaculum marinum TaxID=1764581 RepID=A0AAW9RM58_9HYPH